MGEFEGGEVCAKPSLAVPGRAWPPLASPGRAWSCLSGLPPPPFPGLPWPRKSLKNHFKFKLALGSVFGPGQEAKNESCFGGSRAREAVRGLSPASGVAFGRHFDSQNGTFLDVF